MDPWGLSEIEPPTKEHTVAGPSPWPCIYIVDMQLGLHKSLEQVEQELPLKLLPVCIICYPNLPILSSFGEKSA